MNSQEKGVTGRQLLVTAFVSGAAVMMIEISAARLLAPYFGTSIFIWTNIIGVVLIALSAGYYIGGRMADRRPDPRILFSIIAAAGVIGMVIPWVVRPVARYLTLDALLFQSGSFFIFFSSFIVSLVIFAVPLGLLGIVSPFIIKLHAAEDRVGESSGIVFAISTIGSIVGTYLPTLWLIPTFGTNATVMSAGALLVAVAFWYVLRSATAKVAVTLSAFILVSLASGAGIRRTSATLYEGESAYQYIRVQETADGARQLMYNEGISFQSEWHPERILTGYYYDYYQTLPLLFDRDRDLNVLILGLAGGTISRQLYNFYGDRVRVDGVEIDKKVLDVAYTYFDLSQPNLSVYEDDGVVYLMRTNKKYDIIIIDAYQNQYYIPWTMTTIEFWKMVTEKLSPNGIVAMNVVGGPSSLLPRAIMNTQTRVFDHVFALRAGRDNLNMMVIASDSSLNFGTLRGESAVPELEQIANTIADSVQLIQFDPDGLILTNDKAPVEFLTDSILFGL